jgi:acyl-CoA thioester hydrolase
MRDVRHEKRIDIRWRDVDAYEHVNNAVYATYLEEVRDELLRSVLDGAGNPWDWVLARVAIDFRRELRLEDESAVAWCEIARLGNSSVTLREGVRAKAGWIAAEAEAVVVAWDRESGGSRPLTDAERAAFESAVVSS